MAKPRRKPRRWTDFEIAFLQQHYGPMSVKQMAAKLDRPLVSIYKKLKQLGIEKYSSPYTRTLKGIKPGARVRVDLPALPGLKTTAETGIGGRWVKRRYKGEVLQVYERFILVQLPGWRECINVGSIIAGEAQIELLERGKVA